MANRTPSHGRRETSRQRFRAPSVNISCARVRLASTLIFRASGGTLVAHNYLLRTQVPLPDWLLKDLLAIPENGTPVEELSNFLDHASAGDLVAALLRGGILVLEGTSQDQRDTEFRDQWSWPVETAYFHFGMKGMRFVSDEEAIRLQEEKAKTQPSPNLIEPNDGFDVRAQLPLPDLRNQHMNLMYQRRSNRNFVKDQNIQLESIADCLFSGLGITGLIKNPKICDLPLKITPSGGARNPYEGYLFAYHINGLTPGVYHYCGASHDLGLVCQSNQPQASDLLGGQAWAENCAAIVLLVARLERTMWKYPDSNAYRVVTIEAGHIAQNIILMANVHGLAGNPTSAISDDIAEQALGSMAITHGPVHAVAIGYAEPAAPHSTLDPS